ncbi:MAG: pyridine nucleotide-disulfide oxidoreductase [Planctomycetota bacterium]
MSERVHDLIVVGAGPTGIALGAEAVQHDLDVLLVDKGALTQALLDFPTFMNFFTTRDLMEIAGIPMSIPHDKPTRQDALAYFHSVAAHYKLPLALHEEVTDAHADGDGFVLRTVQDGQPRVRRARAVALATGYFSNPICLEVPGAELPWVHGYYRDPYRHFGEHVVIVGAGNSGCEAALEMYRNHVRVSVVHRGSEPKQSVKFWVKPDFQNRVSEGSINAYFEHVPVAFEDKPRGIRIRPVRGGEERFLACDAVYTLVGFLTDVDLERRCGVRVDPRTLVPEFDPATCESNVPGLYIAGTLQAGRDTHAIFIENSRLHAPKIVKHLKSRLRSATAQ